MCDAYETFEELIEDEEDPKLLLENLKSKSTNLPREAGQQIIIVVN